MNLAEPEGSAPLSKKALKEGIRDVLGGGSDVNAVNPLPVTPGVGAIFDVSDRPGRLVGIIYGDQGQLAQRLTGEILVQLNQAGVEASDGNPIPVQNALPEIKASLFRHGVVAATDFLADEINTTMTYPVIWRIYAGFNAVGVLSLHRRIGAFTRIDELNAGVGLAANAAYMFDVMVEDGEEIQFQYSVNAWINSFKVAEVKGMM